MNMSFTAGTQFPWLESATASSVEQVFGLLSRNNAIWGKEPELNWIFRGQAKEWPLLPRAWRSDDPGASALARLIDPYKPSAEDNAQRSVLHPNVSSNPFYNFSSAISADPGTFVSRAASALLTVYAETELVKWFVRFADMVALPTPDADLPRGNHILTAGTMTSNWSTADGSINHNGQNPSDWWFNWAPQEVHGLAQHHGVPTRLLDWTFDPRVAAFFASKNDAKPENTDDAVVYALNVRELKLQHTPGGHDNGKVCALDLTTRMFDPHYARAWVMQFSRNKNQNLHAQHGVFTYIRGSERYFMQNGEWPTIFDIIDLRWRLWPDLLKQKPIMRALKIPARLTNDLRLALYREGVSLAHLFPGFGNIWETVSWRLTQAPFDFET